MRSIIEIVLLSAAIDGIIDADERETIISRFAHTKRLLSVSEGQLLEIQNQLLSRIMAGQSKKEIVQFAAHQLSQDHKLFCYAVVVDVVMSNLVIEKSEADYLKLLRDQFNLDTDDITSIHFSAKVRYGLDVSTQ